MTEDFKVNQIQNAIKGLDLSPNSLLEIAKFCGGLFDEKLEDRERMIREKFNGRKKND